MLLDYSDRLGQRFIDRRGERCEPRLDVLADVHTQRTPAALDQYRQVAASLRRFHHAERELVARNFDIRGIVARDLQEHAGVRPAFVSLTGRVQEPRPEPEAGRDLLLRTNL